MAAAGAQQTARAAAEIELGQLRAAVNALRTELEHERQRGEAARDRRRRCRPAGMR